MVSAVANFLALDLAGQITMPLMPVLHGLAVPPFTYVSAVSAHSAAPSVASIGVQRVQRVPRCDDDPDPAK